MTFKQLINYLKDRGSFSLELFKKILHLDKKITFKNYAHHKKIDPHIIGSFLNLKNNIRCKHMIYVGYIFKNYTPAHRRTKESNGGQVKYNFQCNN